MVLKTVLIAGVLAGATANCPTYLRSLNSFMPSAAGVDPVDVYVNGAKVQSSVTFRTMTPYLQASAQFTAASGKFYTAGFLGLVAGPTGPGAAVYSSPPVIVNEDARVVPNVNRFNGLWYRWSETNLVIDFRTIRGDPAPEHVSGAYDVERITDLTPKTVIPIGELPTGVRYSFYPVGVNSTTPLNNPRLTSNGGVVAVRNLLPRNGHTYDFIAAGDSLLNANDYNLEVRFVETPIALDRATGCTIIPGTVDYALARQSVEPARANLQQTVYESIPDGTVKMLNGVTIATLVCAAITLALTLLHSLRALIAHTPVTAHSKAVAGSV